MTKERGFYPKVYEQLKPALFRLDPEDAHRHVLTGLKLAGKSRQFRNSLTKGFTFDHPELEVQLWGETADGLLAFKNQVGLAAGFCKDADPGVVGALACLGFGHIEVGSVTEFPREGNHRPRIFRLPEDNGTINCMNLNNPGVEVFTENLRVIRKSGILEEKRVKLGVNIAGTIGKENGMGDPRVVFRKVYRDTDFIDVNLSCPNHQGYSQRALMEFADLADQLVREREWLSQRFGYRPIIVKISPDWEEEEVDQILEIVDKNKLDGIVATNTTQSREGINGRFAHLKGGLSGQPLKQRSTEVIRYIHRQMPELTIIGVGGTQTPEDAWEKIQAGARLVQVYTGMIFEGPSIVKNINRGLMRLKTAA